MWGILLAACGTGALLSSWLAIGAYGPDGSGPARLAILALLLNLLVVFLLLLMPDPGRLD